MTVRMDHSTVLPFWGRVTVMESPVDETQRESGLIVPMHYEPGSNDNDRNPRRGVVLHIDQSYHKMEGYGPYAARLEPGTVVYFTHGYRVNDMLVVQIHDILAYEGAPEEEQ